MGRKCAPVGKEPSLIAIRVKTRKHERKQQNARMTLASCEIAFKYESKNASKEIARILPTK